MTVRCTDNPRLALVGCGATYGGERQHSVARVSWSEHPDGRAHQTFATVRAADMCWHGDTMRDPRTLHRRNGNPVVKQDAAGIWHHWHTEPHPKGAKPARVALGATKQGNPP